MKLTQRLSLRVEADAYFLILVSITGNLQFVARRKTTDNNRRAVCDTQLMLFQPDGSTLDLNRINARSAWRIRQRN